MSVTHPVEPLPFRAVYITGRDGPHPMHKALVEKTPLALGRRDAVLQSVTEQSPRWQQYLSWVVNGWVFPGRKDYDLFVLQGFLVSPMLMKWMRRITPEQRVVCHHVAEQLYFLQTGFYSKRTDWGMRQIIKGYDAHLCVGQEQTRLLREIAPKARVYNVYCTHISEDKYQRFTRLTPSLEEKRILFVGNIYGSWRVHYKGLDLLLEAFHLAVQRDPSLSLTLIGVHQEAYQRLTQGRYPPSTLGQIENIAFAQDLAPYFERHSLFLLPARGDAFPTVVLEAIASGVVPMLSEATGNKEVAAQIAPELVVPLDAAQLAQRLHWYFGLSPEARAALSARGRVVAENFTEEKGVARFREALLLISRDLKIPGAPP
jgi:glycosyltransferase involved in cell wall biosynthesis